MVEYIRLFDEAINLASTEIGTVSHMVGKQEETTKGLCYF